jgi:hypothetical protein
MIKKVGRLLAEKKEKIEAQWTELRVEVIVKWLMLENALVQ